MGSSRDKHSSNRHSTPKQQTHKRRRSSSRKHTSSKQQTDTMAFNEAFTAMNAYAQEQGITFGEALESMKSHPEYPKPAVVARARSPRRVLLRQASAGSPSSRCHMVRGPPDVHRRPWQRVCQGGTLLRLRAAAVALPREPLG